MLWHLLIAGMLGLAVGIACSLPPNPGMTLVAAPGLTVGAFALMIWSDIRFGGTIGGPAAEQSAWPTLLPFLLLLAVPFGQFFAPTLTPGGAITAGALVGLAFLAYLRWYQRRQMRTVATSTDEEPSGPFG